MVFLSIYFLWRVPARRVIRSYHSRKSLHKKTDGVFPSVFLCNECFYKGT